MRTTAAVAAVLVGMGVGAGLLTAPPTPAEPAEPAFDPHACNDAFCTPGITPRVVLGSYCSDTTNYVFATAVAGPSIREGRLVFCGSPRRYEPRYFRSPPMVGIKEENANCAGYENKVAQSPDGLFLSCVSADGRTFWERGNLGLTPPPA